MEILVELLLEFVLQIVVEGLCALGLHLASQPFWKPLKPWLAAFGYALLGAILGFISLEIFPAHAVTNQMWRWANVIVTPLAAGATMAGLGRRRARRGKPLVRIDHFSYGYLFALSLALVRLSWAT